MIIVGSVASLDIAVNFVDSAYALMVIPTMISFFISTESFKRIKTLLFKFIVYR